MAFNDIPVSISNIGANLRCDAADRVTLTAKRNGRTLGFALSNAKCIVTTHNQMFIEFITPIVCNPRSAKPKRFLVLKCDKMDELKTLIKPYYDTTQWNCASFVSIGYGKQLYVSPADIDLIFIADNQSFKCVKPNEVDNVQFLRTFPGTRSFDVEFKLSNMDTCVFENIDKSELCRLHSCLTDIGMCETVESESSSSEYNSDSDWNNAPSSEDDSSDSSAIYESD